ncbi:MAG: methyltransferase [Gemmobacter sp.]
MDGATVPRGWINRLAASRRFHGLAARLPVLHRIARAEGMAIFDLMQGFVASQMLLALVELRILHRLAEAPCTPEALAALAEVSEDRMRLLLQAGAAMGLLKRRRDGRFALARRGAVFLGVPGLEGMVRHQRVLYGDLADPVAFLRGRTEPELARFWPYVLGPGAAADPRQAAVYSRLMADTQSLVAEETLARVDLGGVRRLMDVGGGTGLFLAAAAARYPALQVTLFDLPAVVAQSRLGQLGPRAQIVAGSFRDGPLPEGADAISLVRVLYDHDDRTVAALLARCRAALPPGGRLIVSEPMSGGARPDRAADLYFALYTAAMNTGRTRSAAEIAELAVRAGFSGIRVGPRTRSFVTCVLLAVRPA